MSDYEKEHINQLRGRERLRGLAGTSLVVAQLRGYLTTIGRQDLRLRGFADRLAELEAIGLGDEPEVFAGSGDPAAESVVGLAMLLLEFERIENLTLDEELDELIRACSSVDHWFFTPERMEMFRMRYGLNGKPPATLEAVGQSVGLTRERVRQITDRGLKNFNHLFRSSAAPALERALNLIADSAPCRPEDVPDILIASGIAERSYSFESIDSIACLFGRDVPFTVDQNVGVIRPEMREGIARAVRSARKSVEHVGVGNISDVYSECVLDDGSVGEDELRAALELLERFEWLGNEFEYFLIRTPKRNRLVNQITKVMSVAGSIEIGELRDGISRHYRMAGLRHPTAVLSEWCEKSGFLRVDGSRVIGLDGLPDWSEALDGIELTLAEILFDSGPIMRKTDLMEEAMARGCNENSLGVYLTYSPILKQFARGVWGLRGAETSAAKIEALVSPLEKAKVLKGWGWTSSGRVWTCHRLSNAAVRSAVLTTPVGFHEVLRGKYELFEGRGQAKTKIGDLVVQGQMWGLSPFFSSGRVEAGDWVRIEYDLTERTAELRIGGEELALG